MGLREVWRREDQRERDARRPLVPQDCAQQEDQEKKKQRLADRVRNGQEHQGQKSAGTRERDGGVHVRPAAHRAICTQNMNAASRNAPRMSPRRRRRLPAASNAAATIITTSTAPSMLKVRVSAVEFETPGVRSGLVHGSITAKKTGCP